jgi:NAD-dependent dihydropyrimidine dehydrogenase PreA subunit
MEIDKEKCVGCGNCHAVCTMGVIYLDEDGKSAVNQDEGVECNTCNRVLPVEYGKLRRLTPQKAANIMARCCECGAFNPVRAEQLLEKMVKG